MSNVRPLTETARGRAVATLIEAYDGEVFCHDILASLQSERPLSSADAALAAELSIGVSRHRITCEHIASRFYRGRWLGLRLPQRVLLAVGVYQLCWLDRIPEYAAVDESVRLARRYGKGAVALTNAILRQVASARGEIVSLHDGDAPRRLLPLDGATGRRFGVDIFPDPARKSLDYLIAAYSHPPWLVERWHRRFKPLLCRQILAAGQRRPVLALRPNLRRIGPERLIQRLVDDGISCDVSGDGRTVFVRGLVSATDLAVIQEGLCQPQDSTAQIALSLTPPRRGQFVVDLCAGSGTKSTQAAEMMENEGLVLATDTAEERLGRIGPAADRLGLSNIRVCTMADLSMTLAAIGRVPDIILTDVPCLNSGVLARRPEARYRAGQRALTEIVAIQREILEQAEQLAGGTSRIIYSTCSLEHEENELQVERFLRDHPSWTLLDQRFTLPSQDADGGFAAVLGRKA